MNIEELVKNFSVLSSKSILTKGEQEEARQLMKQLKKSGMSHDEISKLSKGKWTASTVKFYTPGIKAAPHNPWGDTVELLDKLLSSGYSLEDVATALTVSQDLESQGVSLSSVVKLLVAAESSSLSAADMVKQHQLLEEHGLSPKMITEALSLKEKLGGLGLGLDSLGPLVKLAQNFGDPPKIIEALAKYKSLVDLEEQVSAAKAESGSLAQQLASKQQQLKDAQAKLEQAKQPLDACKQAAKLGFGEAELERVASLSVKYGGVKEVLEAIDAHLSYADIVNKTNKATAELTDLESKISKTESEYAHLTTATDLCSSLLHKYKFGLDAIATIYDTAKKYGEPIEVLRAVEAYGKLEALKQELSKLEGVVAQRQEARAQLAGKHQEALQEIESLNATSLKVGSEIGKVEARLANSKELAMVIGFINNPATADYSTYGPIAHVIAAAMSKWVTAHESRFKSFYIVKPGLESLLKALGDV